VDFSVIILAAGRGTRMKTALPKVLHPVAGWPMIYRAVRAAKDAGANEVRVVVGYGESLVRNVVEPLGATCFKQHDQLGTADAVRSAQIENLDGWVVIMNGDHPLITSADLESLLQKVKATNHQLVVVSSIIKDPKDFGRIVRHKGQLRAIVEAKDASADTLKINEINAGLYIVHSSVLKTYLPKIKNHNAKGEFYLTDLIELSIQGGESVDALVAPKHVAFGVNSQAELARATRLLFRQKARELMDEGVVILDPATTYIESSVRVGPGTVLYPGVFLKGSTQIGPFCVLEPNVFINNSVVGESVQIRAGSYLEQAKVQNRCAVGPYARLRPDAELGEEVQIGNFVEIKKAKLGKGTKAAHLTYLGDAEIGENTNIGCGTITCNYAADRKKYKTTIGSNVFVGSDTQFIAPVTIGDNAVIGSGSTITKDVPAKALAVARGRQVVKENYVTDKNDTAEKEM
jgi:bifunctional UDP-N-acetylglucosamine pyrophosphorylase/glucosamine-1-phosphate N-acetyltransferase